MELFALTKEAPRIRKVILQGDAQDELEETAHEQIENFMSFEECYALDAQYRPEDHEAFKVSDFEDLDGIIEAVKEPAGVLPWDTNEDDIEVKGFFFGVQGGDGWTVGLQIFDRRQLISNKFTLLWSKNSFERVKGLALSLDNKLAAVVKENENNLDLYFKSLHNARRLFDMDMYFKEATEQDVNDFFEGDLFSGYDRNECLELIDNWCRKKIAFILKEERFNNLTATHIKSKADELNVEINVEKDKNGEDKIQFPDEKKTLKRILRFLDEDIYKSSLTNTIFVANSKRKD